MYGRALAAILLLTCLAPACDDKPESPAGDTEPPFLFIVAPSDSATLVGPDSIRIAATDDEVVVRVAAYLDADSLGEDLLAPYAIAFNPLRVGADTFTLQARAWDAAGNRGEAPVITIFTPAAALRITQPAADAVVSGEVAVRIEAVRPELIAEVKLLVDGIEIGTAAQLPAAIDWDTEPWSDGGPHLLQAAAQAGGTTLTSPAVRLQVAPGSQGVPSMVTPQEGADEYFSEVAFSWTHEPYAHAYNFQLARDSYFSPVIFSASTADTALIHEVASIGWHYARVRANFGTLGWSTWSSPRRFRHAGETTSPLPLLPAQDCVSLSDTVEYSWAAPAEMDEFEFVLARDLTFTQPILSAFCAEPSLSLTDYETGWRYYHVRARRDGEGWSSWSPMRRFRHGSPLEGGICKLHIPTAGNALALSTSGDLLLAGSHATDALAFGLDAAEVPAFFANIEFDGSSALVHCAFPRSQGGWSLLTRTIGASQPFVLLDLAADGHELARIPVSISYYPEGRQLDLLDEGSALILLQGPPDYPSTLLTRLSAQGAPLWSHEWPYDSWGGHWGVESWNYYGISVLSLSPTRLALLMIVDNHWHNFDDEYPDGDRYVHGELAIYDPENGERQGEVVLPAEELGAACVDSQGSIGAIGFATTAGESYADSWINDDPTLFLVSSDLGTIDVLPLAIEPWQELGFKAIAALGAGDFVVAGKRGDNALIFRVLADGTLLWLREFGEAGPADIFNDLVVLDTGEILAIGTTASYGYVEHSLWIKYLDSAGNDITSARIP